MHDGSADPSSLTWSPASPHRGISHFRTHKKREKKKGEKEEKKKKVAQLSTVEWQAFVTARDPHFLSENPFKYPIDICTSTTTQRIYNGLSPILFGPIRRDHPFLWVFLSHILPREESFAQLHQLSEEAVSKASVLAFGVCAIFFFFCTCDIGALLTIVSFWNCSPYLWPPLGSSRAISSLRGLAGSILAFPCIPGFAKACAR